MEEIVTEEICKKITYKGACPECGNEQISTYKSCVDTKCQVCKDKRFKQALESLSELGVDIEFISYPEIRINSISFKFNGETFYIDADHDDCTGSYMVIY